MTILKNSDRAEVLRRVTEAAFAPRFAAVAERIGGIYRARLVAEHPRFLELMADEGSRRYVSVVSAPNPLYLHDGSRRALCAPRSGTYGKLLPLPTRAYPDREHYAALKPDDVVVPTSVDFATIEDAGVTLDYHAVWSDYHAAVEKLSALLYSYATREKFVTEFPEYERFLPPVEQKAKLPAVIVADVRAGLSALGIPAEAS